MAFRVLDLFCGAGGFSLGFKMANFDIVGGIDFDQEALDTHKLNFKDGFHFCGDISELDDEFVLENFDAKVDDMADFCIYVSIDGINVPMRLCEWDMDNECVILHESFKDGKE